jgi:hypothetical protein
MVTCRNTLESRSPRRRMVRLVCALLVLGSSTAQAAATGEERRATLAMGGLMYEASSGGQKFNFTPL